MSRYPALDRAMEDMLSQPSALYQPTAFWREASSALAHEIAEQGIERFRQLKGPLGYFVPTYGSLGGGGGFTLTQSARVQSWIRSNYPDERKAQLALDGLLSGEIAALADYRVLLAGNLPSERWNLLTFSESTFGQPVEHFSFEGRRYSRSSLNYLLGLTLLKRHLNGEHPRNVLEIGGGFGVLGEILAQTDAEGLRYINIDIPPLSYVAECYLRAAVGDSQVATYTSTANKRLIDIATLPTASALCTWQIERLHGKVDLFVNFISFQEMEPPIVRNYLSQVDRLRARWVLLRNLREGKQRRRAGELGVDEPIRGDEYIEMLSGYTLVDRNVFPFGYRTIDGFHSELLLFRRES